MTSAPRSASMRPVWSPLNNTAHSRTLTPFRSSIIEFTRRLERDENVLGTDEFRQPRRTALAAEAALLDAAERRVRRHVRPAVHVDVAAFELVGEAVGTLNVACMHIGAEAVVAGVRLRDRVLLVLEGRNREHGAEHFFLCEMAGLIDLAEQRRLDKESTGQSAAGARAARQQLARLLALRTLDDADDAIGRDFRDDG